MYFIFSALRADHQLVSGLSPLSVITAKVNVKAIITTVPWEPTTRHMRMDFQGHFKCFICTTYCIFKPCLLISDPTYPCWFSSFSEYPTFTAVKGRKNNWGSMLLQVLPPYADWQILSVNFSLRDCGPFCTVSITWLFGDSVLIMVVCCISRRETASRAVPIHP